MTIAMNNYVIKYGAIRPENILQIMTLSGRKELNDLMLIGLPYTLLYFSFKHIICVNNYLFLCPCQLPPLSTVNYYQRPCKICNVIIGIKIIYQKKCANDDRDQPAEAFKGMPESKI